MNHHSPALIAVLLLTCVRSHAQEISPINKHAWGENIGFLNFADAGDPPGSQAVFVNCTYLEGYVWGGRTSVGSTSATATARTPTPPA